MHRPTVTLISPQDWHSFPLVPRDAPSRIAALAPVFGTLAVMCLAVVGFEFAAVNQTMADMVRVVTMGGV